MTPVRALFMVAAVLALFAWPGSAAAYPPYTGAQMFPTIHGSADPEEYSWQVQLNEGETLEAGDDQTVVVRWENGTVAFEIKAEPAHDATGAAVPTTIAVTDVDLITLTVHHRAGNPAAGGVPFTYPVNAGRGWEGGFATVIVQFSEPPPPLVAPAPVCLVPSLAGKSLKASRRVLRISNCVLGPVRGERRRGARVVRQYRDPGLSLPAGSAVGVKLG